MRHLNKNNIKGCPETIGVYKIYAFDDIGIAIPISRFGGVDDSGLLYIGETTKQNLKRRIHNFWMTSRLELNTHNHSGALKYRLNETIRKVLGINHILSFDVEFVEKPKQREKELLNEYAAIYGEFPPLNR